MKWISNIFREIFGLFVDDGSFALAILIWLTVLHWAVPYLRLAPAANAAIFFVGLALILAESALRYARSCHPKR
ncbi:MAG: hypothetical protein BGO25_18045 [Acidobacteriales bacterium 59-55]|nr:hypothetical protein [Terriglobales bacterium]OJV41581.1 MAG: hypothetical protein BGO25_18045 [Acidobacteriales bacterium 59-55]